MDGGRRPQTAETAPPSAVGRPPSTDKEMRMKRLSTGGVVAGLAAALALPLASLALMVSPASPLAGASSHREAPMVSQDPAADGTDFYLFTSPENNGTITFVYNTWPFE